ncbi:hydroxyethylthiazole kinase [Tanacetum coccineum]
MGNKNMDTLITLRQQSPLIQCITNLVSMDIIANALTSAGASPAMTHSLLEIPDFTPQTQAVFINIGTLMPERLPGMKCAAGIANELAKPWVLDPAAVGASSFRLNACLELLALRPTGPDSLHESSDALEAAKSLAKSSGSIVAISGSVDYVTDGHRVVGAHNGVQMMQKITASGCAVSALIAAFIAIDPAHAFEATVSAFAVYGLAGEIAMGLAKGPASLRMHLIDSLHSLDEDTVINGVKITSFS